MTFPASVANLTKAVNEITAETNVPRSTLDAKVAQAEAEVPLAQAEQAAAEGYRDTAATHAADAATHLATVQANVTYDGIEAILAEKAVTAVDVFVYDTSLDSDGGAWRKRCQHTSWYSETLNTATRGARREFPVVAVIVAETGVVRIYDGDDPALPMWIAFNLNNQDQVSIAALNGVVVFGNKWVANAAYGGNGLNVLDFAGDRWRHGMRNGSVPWLVPEMPYIKSGNMVSWFNVTTSGLQRFYQLRDYSINDVAMAVLPDAPVDPITGLPVPTIAVAANGGVSVIKDDGSVWDIYNSDGVNMALHVGFTADGRVAAHLYDDNRGIRLFDMPNADVVQPNHYSQGNAAEWYSDTVYGEGTNLRFIGSPTSGTSTKAPFVTAGPHLLRGSTAGLSHLQRDRNSPTKGMVAYTTSTYNTGWLPGNIKGAFLADTDDTDLVGSGELVTNGTFDSDLSGWTPNNLGLLAVDTQRLKVETGNSGSWNYGYQQVSVTPGQAYRFRASSVEGTAATHRILLGTGITNGNIVMNGGALGSSGDKAVDVVFTATTSSVYIALQNTDGVLGSYTFFDNISLVPASADRSVNNKGLIVNGTITRSPVATGADLVAYSGFSASNYLEQPYNSDLDFGTGDFCVMGWFIKGGSNSRYLLDRRKADDSDNTGRISILSGTDNKVAAVAFDVSGTGVCSVTSVGAISPTSWVHFTFLRRGSIGQLYLDGVLVGTDTTAAGNITSAAADATLRVGGRHDLGNSWDGSLALIRISATAPTADQIAKIYEDERKLFQPGAQCTLSGTSDAVTALAHDPKTNLLHVGTSQGRSVFDGLQRVANTETPVGTAISAVNGLIVEE